MKGIAAGIGVVVLSPLLLAGTAMMMESSSEATTTASFSGCLTGIDTGEVTKEVTKLLDGASAKDVHIQGLDLPAEQIPNAQTIVATGISLYELRTLKVLASLGPTAVALAAAVSDLRHSGYVGQDAEQRALTGFSEAEREQLRGYLHRVRENLRRDG